MTLQIIVVSVFVSTAGWYGIDTYIKMQRGDLNGAADRSALLAILCAIGALAAL